MAVCVLIPAYNAERTIRPVVRECIDLGYPVVLVDDGSLDGTAGIVAGLAVTILTHRVNQGKGMALRTGFQWALEHGFEIIVTIDADGQHDASALPGLVAAAEAAAADIMIASRFSQFAEMSGPRKVWNRFGVWCMRKRTGLEISDSQSGFRCYSGRLLSAITLESGGYDLEMEILMKAWQKGFTIASLPVAARIADGRSTSHYRPFRDTWNICMTFLRHM